MLHAIRSAGIALLAAVPASADYLSSYAVTLDTGQPVTRIMMLERGEFWGGMTWAFEAGGVGQSVLTNPFPKSDPMSDALLIGIVQGLASDPNPEEKHVVLFLSDEAAELSEHIAWGTLFRNTLEEQLIAHIELATSGQDWPIIQPGLDAVVAFAEGDATSGILGPGGVPVSAWFVPGGTFSAMTWSEGLRIGAGVSELIELPPPCPGDLNGDHIVDLLDLTVLLSGFGITGGATLGDGDVNGDGNVDLNDLTLLLAAFGSSC